MKRNDHLNSRDTAALFALGCLILLAACRKEPATLPAPAPVPQGKATSSVTSPSAAATATVSPKPVSQPMKPSPAPDPSVPPPAPATIKVPLDGPDIFLRDQRPAVDYAQVFREQREAALKGSARAQAKLGQMFWNAHGTARNPTNAVEWLRKAAEQGDAEGQYYLGHAYEQGFGVAKDEAEAVRWKRKALEQGFQPTLPSGGSDLSRTKQ